MAGAGKIILYEFRNISDGQYLAETRSGKSYKAGDEVVLTDEMIHRNNSKRLRTCIIKKIEQDSCSGTMIAYLMPTNLEFKPFACLDWEKLLKRSHSSIDWDGLDGYLQTR